MTLCTTMDCAMTATHIGAIYDGVSDQPVEVPYCRECAETLARGGDEVWPMDPPSDPCELCHGTGRFVAAPSDECAMCVGTGSERVVAIRTALNLVRRATLSEQFGFPEAADEQMRVATRTLAEAVGLA